MLLDIEINGHYAPAAMRPREDVVEKPRSPEVGPSFTPQEKGKNATGKKSVRRSLSGFIPFLSFLACRALSEGQPREAFPFFNFLLFGSAFPSLAPSTVCPLLRFLPFFSELCSLVCLFSRLRFGGRG